MPIPIPPVPGEEAVPFLTNSSMWASLLDMLGAYQRGEIGPSGQNGEDVCSPSLVATTADDIPYGEIRQLLAIQPDLSSVTDNNEALIDYWNPRFTFEDPVWHTKIDNLVLVIESNPVSDGNSSLYQLKKHRYYHIPITDSTFPAYSTGYLMVDPSTPTRLKSCKTSGIYRAIGFYNRGANADHEAIIDSWYGQHWWKYELTQNSQAPSDTTAKLLDLEDTEFAASINLSDPEGFMDNQVTGDQGWCVHIGNKFYPIQAVC